MRVNRRAVDLAAFPDLIVIYLGMRVRTLAGIKTLLGLGPQIEKAGASRPEGLLHFENNIIFSVPAPRRNAVVLEGFRVDGAVDALGTAPYLVAGVSAQFRRYWLLA